MIFTPEQAQEYGRLILEIERAKAQRALLDSQIRIYAADAKFCRECGIQTPEICLPNLPEFEEGSIQ